MKINKTTGSWISNSILLDDVAYSLYLNKLEENKEDLNNEIEFCIAQDTIMRYKNQLNMIKDLYIEAEKIILKNERFNKLIKINN